MNTGPGFTNPNNREHAKRSHDAGCQLGKVNTEVPNAMSHEHVYIKEASVAVYDKSTGSREAKGAHRGAKDCISIMTSVPNIY